MQKLIIQRDCSKTVYFFTNEGNYDTISIPRKSEKDRTITIVWNNGADGVRFIANDRSKATKYLIHFREAHYRKCIVRR